LTSSFGVGQPEIEQNELRRLFDDERDRLLARLGFERAIALGF
jgi:hypothetical protein